MYNKEPYIVDGFKFMLLNDEEIESYPGIISTISQLVDCDSIINEVFNMVRPDYDDGSINHCLSQINKRIDENSDRLKLTKDDIKNHFTLSYRFIAESQQSYKNSLDELKTIDLDLMKFSNRTLKNAQEFMNEHFDEILERPYNSSQRAMLEETIKYLDRSIELQLSDEEFLKGILGKKRQYLVESQEYLDAVKKEFIAWAQTQNKFIHMDTVEEIQHRITLLYDNNRAELDKVWHSEKEKNCYKYKCIDSDGNTTIKYSEFPLRSPDFPLITLVQIHFDIKNCDLHRQNVFYASQRLQCDKNQIADTEKELQCKQIMTQLDQEQKSIIQDKLKISSEMIQVVKQYNTRLDTLVEKLKEETKLKLAGIVFKQKPENFKKEEERIQKEGESSISFIALYDKQNEKNKTTSSTQQL